MEPEIIGNRIKELMKKQNIIVEDLANQIGLKTESLNNKLDGKEEFYLDEMNKIKEIFKLDEKQCDELFFKEDCKI